MKFINTILLNLYRKNSTYVPLYLNEIEYKFFMSKHIHYLIYKVH